MLECNIPVTASGHVLIKDETTGEILLDKHNAIHPQNMSRIISRALANEGNSIVHRMAFGNGGTFIDAGSNTVFKNPNDGTNGGGWESRLYNETYSEVVDEDDPNHKIDTGSAGSDNIRIGGGSSPEDDPSGGGVVSYEAGNKSNIVVTMFMNENEPSGQLPTDAPIPSLTEDESFFVFDEIGLYSPGKSAVSTSGISSVDVGDKISEDDSGLVAGPIVITLTVDGTPITSNLTVPASGTGSGGAITYGDLCEAINTDAWLDSGSPSIASSVYVFITDRSGGTYPTITGKQSFGNVSFQSKTTGVSSSIDLSCTLDATNLFNLLTSGVCAKTNVGKISGDSAGVQNDANDSTNERERLLTHIVFSPILKSVGRLISITYTLTISTASTSDSCFNTTLP